MLRGRHQHSWEREGFRSWRHSSKAALVHRMSSEGFGLMVSLHPLQPWQRGVRAGDSLNNLRLAARAAWRERLHPCPMSSRRPLPRPSASRAHALRAAGRCQGNGGFARRGTSSCWRPHAPLRAASSFSIDPVLNAALGELVLASTLFITSC